ncbi:Calmodulin-binding protein 60 C [Ananas comosus]|uniref:Calmodulin-binding protein 60 C n=1 Tax=Ananas comosus TaxID=4615 RepID=A0A199W5J5_ANACO|nr:Calmodulin-binding protein 60 C [Ananas comosus]
MQRPTRQLGRSGSMAREKRGLDPAEDEGRLPEPKRPRVPKLASVIVEALKVDSLQKICSSLEPILRRVVSEEVERALAKLGPARLQGRSSPKRIEGPDGRNLQLNFRTRLSLPLFTGGKVEGEQGAAIHVVLLDANTGHVVTEGPESSAKLDVLVLEGDFNQEDDDDWTEEEFETHVVKEREGKRPLLTGDLQVSLKEGVGTLGEMIFTDNSSWIRSRKFRLGLKVAPGFCEGVRVREAKTEAFTVKDHRGELYKKHYPPALKDDVWRLEKIGKDGAFHKKLNQAGIYTVEDFLRLVVRDPQKLRNILGSGMSNKMWEILVEHAKTCVLSGKYYVYYSDDTRNVGAIFNNIYEFTGLIAGGQYFSAESLIDSQKVFADTLVKQAYDNWIHVVEYDGKVLLNFKQNKKSVTTRNDTRLASSSYPVQYDQQSSEPSASIPVPVEQPSMDRVAGGVDGNAVGYNGNQLSTYSTDAQHFTPNIQQFESTSFAPESQFNNTSSHQTHKGTSDLALRPPQQSSFDFMVQSSRPTDLNLYDEYLTEDEIRMRSHEILENEEMQHLLRVLSGAPTNVAVDGMALSYMPSPCPNFNFDEEQRSTSGKAVVGWLKIKAAMRWGIFVRKKAAERRAQLVELDD